MLGYSSLRSNPYSRHSGGFSLVELVFSIMLIGMMATVGSSIIADTFTTTRRVNAANASADHARYAVERLAREIREARYGAAGTIDSSTLTPTKLCFVNTSGVTVAIIGDGTNLKLGHTSGVSPTCTPGTPATLSTQVAANGFALAYLDASGAVINSPSSNVILIRFVQITLTVKDTATSGESTTQRTRVALRNA